MFAAFQGASIDIISGIIVKMSAPGREQTALSPVRLMYVASNVSRTYMSLSTLTALGVVGETFPRIGDKIAEVASTSTVQGASGVPVPGEQQCSSFINISLYISSTIYVYILCGNLQVCNIRPSLLA